MNKFAIAAVAFVLSSGIAFAQAQTQATPVNVTFAGATAQSVLLSQINIVCDGTTFNLSDKAVMACATKQMPRLNKAGDAFINTGIGAEFNVLIRQIKN